MENKNEEFSEKNQKTRNEIAESVFNRICIDDFDPQDAVNYCFAFADAWVREKQKPIDLKIAANSETEISANDILTGDTGLMTFITEFQAIDMKSSRLKTYAGPEIEAKSWELAEEQIKNMPWLKVQGKLVASYSL